MTKTIKTLADFCEASHLDSALIRATVRQFGGWESFKESARDVTNHGIDGGFHGFIYNRDTEAFAKRNRALIAELADQQAREMGEGDAIALIRGFNCFRGQDISSAVIGRALYAGKQDDDAENILNALAWYAGEEVCRSYCDLTGEND